MTEWFAGSEDNYFSFTGWYCLNDIKQISHRSETVLIEGIIISEIDINKDCKPDFVIVCHENGPTNFYEAFIVAIRFLLISNSGPPSWDTMEDNPKPVLNYLGKSLKRTINYIPTSIESFM